MIHCRHAADRDIAFIQHRHIDEAGKRHAVTDQPDQRAENRTSADKGTRAINRVDHPAIAAGAALVGMLLAKNVVIGKLRGQRLAKCQLDGFVSHRHGRIICLPFDIMTTAEPFTDDWPADSGKPVKKISQRDIVELAVNAVLIVTRHQDQPPLSAAISASVGSVAGASAC